MDVDYNKFIIIFILIIIIFAMIYRDKRELFYSNPIEIDIDEDNELVTLFKQNYGIEKAKEPGYLGSIPINIAKERYREHLVKLENGYYNYDNQIKKKEEYKEEIQVPNSTEGIQKDPEKKPDLIIKFKS